MASTTGVKDRELRATMAAAIAGRLVYARDADELKPWEQDGYRKAGDVARAAVMLADAILENIDGQLNLPIDERKK